jgi:chromate reductase
MASQYSIAVIVGSLRKGSFSLKIAKALTKLAPPSLQLDVVTLNGLSFYNQDLEATPPADWVSFRERVKKADAVLFVRPNTTGPFPAF